MDKAQEVPNAAHAVADTTAPADTNGKDYSALSSQERIALINNYRRRLIAGESLTDDELREGIRLIRAERLTRTSRGKASTPAAPQKPSKIASLLDGI